MESERRKTYAEYYLGTVVEVIDKSLYQIRVDIPGVFEGVKAFPVRGEIDEPKVGDGVLLRSFDPIYHSYFLYQKLKENDFIGFRSLGKMIEVDPNGEYIQICTFDPETEYTDGDKEKEYRPEPQDWIKIDKDGNMDLYIRANTTAKIDGDGEIEVGGNITITIKGDSKVEISGNGEVVVSGDSKINVSGNSNITVKGNSKQSINGNVSIESTGSVDIKGSSQVTINTPNAKITGGNLTVNGTAAPGTGPFCSIPVCPLSGVPHGGSIVNGT